MLNQRMIDYNHVNFDKNTLFFGDSLDILRDYIPSDFIDLIYVDPPFNSKGTYNILFKEVSGEKSSAQIQAFSDFWHWDAQAKHAYESLLSEQSTSDMIQAFMKFLGKNDMLAYLSMMGVRLLHLHRVLKSSGSIFLHCDTTASHYLKLLMDSIFGVKNFRNEIIWHYQGWGRKLKTSFNRRYDTILFYSKTDKNKFHSYSIPWESKQQYAKRRRQLIRTDENGDYVLSDHGGGRYAKRYLDEAISYGRPVDCIWDMNRLNNEDKENLGFQTQKPVALLERIIKSCTDVGDLVLDAFCGCGSAIIAAERLNRRWIGIDITYLAINLVKSRLQTEFPNVVYLEEGQPKDMIGATALANHDRYNFQNWALSLINARPEGSTIENPKKGKKGADKGIDGSLIFRSADSEVERIIVQVRSGKVDVTDIREFRDVINNRASMGIFITLHEPTEPMVQQVRETESYILKPFRSNIQEFRSSQSNSFCEEINQ